jgi:lipoprotein LprG
MPSRHLRVLGLLAAVLVALITSCGGSPEPKKPPVPTLPAGAELLTKSSQAMRTVETTKFSINVQGDVRSIPFKDAKGQLTKEGQAKGTATIEFGQVVEVEFVITDDALYLRGPTGGFQKLPASAAGMVYDPKAILDPERGISKVLPQGRQAKTEGREQVGGVDTYRVRVSFPAGTLDKFVPGLTKETNGLVWIAAQGSHLVQAQFPAQGGMVLVQLSDFDSPADIRAPS